jgi:hypothetical protein
MKDNAGSLCGAVSRHRQRAGWAAVAGCGLVTVALPQTISRRPREVVAPETKIVVIDLAVDGRSPIHVSVPDGSAAKMAVAGGPRLELIPNGSRDDLDVEEQQATTGNQRTRRATFRM